MSLNDTPGVRDVFAGFTIEEISTVYTAASSGPKAASEVLIMNFDAPLQVHSNPR